MEEYFRDIVTRADEELRLPNSALRVLELTELANTESIDLLNAIQVDPSFAAQLLKLANSSIYARGKPTADLERAVGMLGFREVGQLAIALAASKKLRKIETELLSSTSFWSHSLTTAVLARNTARGLRMPDRGIFAAALLHDLAILIEIGLCTDEMRQALDMSMYSEEVSLLAAENQVLGFDHSKFAGVLFENWGLPEIIVQTAKYHHCPAQAENFQKEVALIAWANTTEQIGTGADEGDWEPYAELMGEIAEIVELKAPEDDTLLQQAQSEAVEMIDLF